MKRDDALAVLGHSSGGQVDLFQRLDFCTAFWEVVLCSWGDQHCGTGDSQPAPGNKDVLFPTKLGGN